MLKRQWTYIRAFSQLSFSLFFLAFTAFLLASPATAQDDSASHAVARVSFTRGDVEAMRGDTGEWVAMVINTPLLAGDAVSTGNDSRAEIQLDHAHLLRLSEHTQAKVANLTGNQVQIQLAQGIAEFATLWDSDGEVEIDTPNVAVRLSGRGTYRIQINSELESVITVRRGAATVFASGGSASLDPDQQMTVRGDDQAEYEVKSAAQPDGWERWNQDRDREITEALSWQHANKYYTGANDLDRYGRWVSVSSYGWCWTPYTASADWVPYLNGRWVWEPYWGWTWVSYEPWGWAPYHYGRWFVSGGVWVWWPGPATAAYRPVYAPAYVSFLGFRLGDQNLSFGRGYAYGSIGWLPVGPSDYYYPWWGERATYSIVKAAHVMDGAEIDVPEITILRPIPPLAAAGQPVQSNLQVAMSTVQVRRALVIIPAETFAKGLIPAKTQSVDASVLDQADVIKGTIPVVPARESLQPVNRTVKPSGVPGQQVSTQHFFAMMTPAPPPQPFSERAAAIRQMVERGDPSRSVDATGLLTAGSASPEKSVGAPQVQAGARPGWRHFGNTAPGQASPVGTHASQVSSADARATRPGWHRFGENEPGSDSASPKRSDIRPK
jgi:FecR protein